MSKKYMDVFYHISQGESDSVWLSPFYQRRTDGDNGYAWVFVAGRVRLFASRAPATPAVAYRLWDEPREKRTVG
jgi:hypothetical protein